MHKKEKQIRFCTTCRRNFENRYGSIEKECRFLESSKLVKRREIPDGTSPMVVQEHREFLDCYAKEGFYYAD